MFHKSNIESALGIDVAVSSKMEEAFRLWASMFEDAPPWKNAEEGKLTMNLPASISSEIARLVTLEMKSVVSGSERADYINEQYQSVIDDARHFMEFACAKGGVVLKPYVSDDRIFTTVVQAEDFYPTQFNHGKDITGGVFVDYRYDENFRYTRLEEHSIDGKTLTIRNRVFRKQISEISANDNTLGDEVSVASIADWADLEPETVIEGAESPLFAYIKMPFANIVESRSPLGISVYAKAVDQIKKADDIWSEIWWEYEAKEAAVTASSTLFGRDKHGTPILPEGKERLFMTFDFDREQKVDTYSPDIRDSSFFNGLNKCLQRIEFLCGLAYGTISEPSMVEKTAEEIKQSKQRSYSTVTDIQKALEKGLKRLIEAIDTLATLYELAPEGELKTTFEWDDSVVVDAETERMRDREDVRDGLMKKWEYRVKWYGETEEQAKAIVGDETEKSDDEILDFINEPGSDDGAKKE